MRPTIDLAVGDVWGPHRIRARSKWNATGVRMNAGEQYVFIASGRWIDFVIPTDADGYASAEAPVVGSLLRRFERRRRAPDEHWFCLTGAIGADGVPFRIGTRSEYRVPPGVSGELSCFANDVSRAYWNNWGAVQLRIERRR